MHARLVTITGADVAAATTFLAENVAPVASQQKGFRQLAAAGDRSRGLISVITVWDSKGDLEASESTFAKVRAEGVAAFGGQVRIQVLEQVAWQVGATPPQPGCVLQLVRYKVEPGQVDDHLDWFRREVLPAIMARPGVRAARNLLDRAKGDGSIGVVYSDRAALDSAANDRRQRMADARSRGFEFGDEDILEVLYGSAPA
jgi:hypothetical protein